MMNQLVPEGEEGFSFCFKSPIFKICHSFTIHLQPGRRRGGGGGGLLKQRDN